MHECRRGCADRGHKNDCQISRLNGWIKGWEVPLLRQGILVKGTGFYRRCHQKVLCNTNNTGLRKPKCPKFFTFNSRERGRNNLFGSCFSSNHIVTSQNMGGKLSVLSRVDTRKQTQSFSLCGCQKPHSFWLVCNFFSCKKIIGGIRRLSRLLIILDLWE